MEIPERLPSLAPPGLGHHSRVRSDRKFQAWPHPAGACTCPPRPPPLPPSSPPSSYTAAWLPWALVSASEKWSRDKLTPTPASSGGCKAWRTWPPGRCLINCRVRNAHCRPQARSLCGPPARSSLPERLALPKMPAGCTRASRGTPCAEAGGSWLHWWAQLSSVRDLFPGRGCSGHRCPLLEPGRRRGRLRVPGTGAQAAGRLLPSRLRVTLRFACPRGRCPERLSPPLAGPSQRPVPMGEGEPRVLGLGRSHACFACWRRCGSSPCCHT